MLSTCQEPLLPLKSRWKKTLLPLHPHLHLQTWSLPGEPDLLLGLEHDRRGASLINLLPNHAGFQNVKR